MDLTENQPDYRLKYVQMPVQFFNMANEIKINAMTQLRRCEAFAKDMAKVTPKTAEQFERAEHMKAFLLSTHDLNTRTMALVGYINDFLGQVAQDANALIEGAVLRDKLREAGMTIQYAWQQRDELLNQLYERRRTQEDIK